MMAHACRGDPADLPGHVGTDGERALRNRIDEPHRILGPPGLQPAGQPVLELDERGVGTLIAVKMRHPQHGLLEPRGDIGKRGQPIAKAFGKEGVGHWGMLRVL